jgi:hypothetical protein
MRSRKRTGLWLVDDWLIGWFGVVVFCAFSGTVSGLCDFDSPCGSHAHLRRYGAVEVSGPSCYLQSGQPGHVPVLLQWLQVSLPSALLSLPLHLGHAFGRLRLPPQRPKNDNQITPFEGLVVGQHISIFNIHLESMGAQSKLQACRCIQWVSPRNTYIIYLLC